MCIRRNISQGNAPKRTFMNLLCSAFRAAFVTLDDAFYDRTSIDTAIRPLDIIRC